MKEYKTEGIIIRTVDYREADRIITVLTRDCGKVRAVAKGCRKQKSRKRGVIQLFTYGDFVFYRGRTLDTVIQCEGKESFGVLREDLDRMAYGAYMAELLDGFVTSGEPHEEVFCLALVCLHLLTAEDPELVTRVFELRLMNLLGYRPHLESCVACGAALAGPRAAFSPGMGGWLCASCGHHDMEAVPCTMGTVNTLRQLSAWDIRRLNVLKPDNGVRREMGEILKAYISHRLEKKIKTAEFLHSLALVQDIGQLRK